MRRPTAPHCSTAARPSDPLSDPHTAPGRSARTGRWGTPQLARPGRLQRRTGAFSRGGRRWAEAFSLIVAPLNRNLIEKIKDKFKR